MLTTIGKHHAVNVVNTDVRCANVSFVNMEKRPFATAELSAINAVDVARLAGVSRAAVSNWRKRFDDFPDPVAGTPTSPLFDPDQIRAWLRDQGKLRELPLTDELWRVLEQLRPVTDPAEALVVIAIGLVYLRTHDTTLNEELDTDELADDAALATAVRRRLLLVHPEHVGLGLPEMDRSWAPLLRLLDRVAEQPHAFDDAVGAWLSASTKPGGMPGIRPELADLLCRIVDTGEILDPFCHAGEVLLRVVRERSGSVDKIAGQHPNPLAVRLAKARLWLETGTAPRIEVGDALRTDAFSGEAFPAVLCFPAWSKEWGFEELQFDPRWTYGLPPRGSGELAWVQHALARLDEHGTAVVAMPPRACFHGQGRRIRAELIRRGVLRAVVALPAGVLSATSVSPVLWILRALPTEDTAPDGVLMIDSSDLRSGRGADWQAVSELVTTAWQEFDVSGEVVERPGQCGVVETIELLDDEVNLTPARHLTGATDVDVDELHGTRERFVDVLARLPQLLPDIEPETEPAGATTTIDELARLGALTVHQQPASTSGDGVDTAVPALTARDVVGGGEPSGSLDGVREPVWLRLDDVVVPMMGGTLASRVIGSERAVLGPQLWLLRPNPEQLDPWFLAGFLRNSVNTVLTTGSVASRLDVRRVQVPRIPVHEQLGYATAFRQLFELEDGLRQVQQYGTELITTMIDGLTNSTLRPPEGPGTSSTTTGKHDDAQQ